ncbi:hypothetical protein [Lactiplantibacillus plantarum]|uniref:hypothetical protein n=1 Tax=Lactiplantibacillus plantarum TaxID=1590 RepID=UPI000B4115DD|nr:hypothetical protein [Lactiplantibacillus plantarum]
MKRVYLYLKNGKYSCYADILDEVKLPPYSTLIGPPEAMINPYWINNQWVDKERVSDKVPNYQNVLAALPTTEQRLAMQQSQQIALLQTTVMQQNQANVKLQSTNQQQEKQINQLQQLFMLTNQQQAVTAKKGEN